jgi:hypothetical protein
MASFEADPEAGPQGDASDVPAEPIATGDADREMPGADEAVHQQSYQELFRAIGAMLDEDVTSIIGIVEVEDGFLVRAERFKQLLTEVSVNHVSRSTLAERIEEMRRVRPPSGKRRHPGIWDSLPVTHQDFFRALGYELDSVGAHHVVIDELSDSLLLRYQQEGTDGGPPVTRQLSLGRAEIEEILNDAVRRRRVAADGKPSDFFRPGRGKSDVSGPQHSSREWILQRANVPYQELLRGLGRALDEQGACQVCVLELPDGFAVRYQVPPENDLSWSQFADDDVLARGPENRWKPVSGGLFRRQTTAPPPPPDGYSDLFRALGYELQRSDVSDILIAEGEDGLTVSYQYRERTRQMTVRRTVKVLGEAELRKLTAQARGRRQPDDSSRR